MMKWIVTGILACLLVVGCAQPSIRWNEVRQLRAGMTTAEVEDIVGSPYSVTAQGATRQIWVWVWFDVMTGRSRNFSVVFENGRATSVPVVPDSFKN